VWLVLKEVGTVVRGFLEGKPELKNVANCPIRVSQILYLTKLISENKAKPFFEEILFIWS
jgi:hypothetical protein